MKNDKMQKAINYQYDHARIKIIDISSRLYEYYSSITRLYGVAGGKITLKRYKPENRTTIQDQCMLKTIVQYKKEIALLENVLKKTITKSKIK